MLIVRQSLRDPGPQTSGEESHSAKTIESRLASFEAAVNVALVKKLFISQTWDPLYRLDDRPVSSGIYAGRYRPWHVWLYPPLDIGLDLRGTDLVRNDRVH